MPELAEKRGHDIVTASGDTLLGADDKAGVAAVMTAVAHLAAHPEFPRPALASAFTPDEEIGEGASRFDLDRVSAPTAPTRSTVPSSASCRTSPSRRLRRSSGSTVSTSIRDMRPGSW